MSTTIQNHFENLLDAEVDRREFLAYCGATLLGVLGVSGLIKALTQSNPSTPNRKVADGYGSSTYGDKS